MKNNKRGLVGWIILAVICAILLIVISVGFYFYNFHVFKTVRVCIGEGQDTKHPCETSQDCADTFNMTEVDLSGVPGVFQGKLQEVLDDMLYCKGTCFVKEIRGINKETNEFEMLDGCEDYEKEVSVDIRGKEGLEIMLWMRSHKS